MLVLAAFDPGPPEEEKAFTAMRQEIGLDPRTESHGLTAKHDGDKLSAKRVLGILTNEDREREVLAIRSIQLDVLLDRGRENGLSEFWAELESRFLPLFLHTAT